MKILARGQAPVTEQPTTAVGPCDACRRNNQHTTRTEIAGIPMYLCDDYTTCAHVSWGTAA